MEKVEELLADKLKGFETAIKFNIDRYNGIRVVAEALPETVDVFRDEFPKLMKEIEKQGARSIWLKLPIAKSSFIEVAAAEGLEFHHTREGNLVMTKWIEKNTDTKLPPYATHYCGVGGFVLNDLDEVLLIKEKYSKDKTRFWKFPGGKVDENESLEDAVKREVKEETGIDATVTGLLGFREVADHLFGKFDLYFVFMMKAIKAECEIKMQEDEISECEWVPCKDIPEKAPLLAPMLQRIAPIFSTEKEVAEKVIEKYREEKTIEAMLKTFCFTNKQYSFRDKNNNLYLNKFMKDCMKLGSKL